MTMKRGLILWGAILCWLGGGGGLAEAINYPRSATLSPFAGAQVFEGNQGLEDGLLKGLSLGANFTRHWGAEVTVGHVDSEARGLAGKGKDRDVWNFFLSGIYHFRPDKRFVPYLLVGAGGYITETESAGCEKADDDEDLLATYGAGFKFTMTDFVDLRGEVRHVFDFNVNDVNRRHDFFHNFAATLGLHFQLVPDDVLIDAGLGPDTLDVAAGAGLPGGPALGPNRFRPEPPLIIPPEASEAALAGVVVPLERGQYQVPSTGSAPPPAAGVDPHLAGRSRQGAAYPVVLTYELDSSSDGSGLTPQVQMELGKAFRPDEGTRVVVEVHASQGSTPLDSFKSAQKKAEKIRFFLIELFDLEPTAVEAHGYGATGYGPPAKQQNTLVLKMIPRKISEVWGPEKRI